MIYWDTIQYMRKVGDNVKDLFGDRERMLYTNSYVAFSDEVKTLFENRGLHKFQPGQPWCLNVACR